MGVTRNFQAQDSSAYWVGYAFVLLVCAFCLTAGALLYLWQRQHWVRLALQVEQLQGVRAELQQVLQPLEAEAGYLSRPQRLATLAESMGLRPPEISQYVLWETSVSAGVPGEQESKP